MGSVVLVGFYVCLFVAAMLITLGLLEWLDERQR